MGYTLRKPKGSTRWHCYFVDRKGARFRRTTKQTDKRRADAVASDWYRRFADPTYQAANETSIDHAATHLKEALKLAGKSAATLKFYGVKLSHVARVLGKDTALSRIDAHAVDDYIATRLAEGAKKYTVSKELTALRQLLKHARRRGEFDKELSQVMPIGFATRFMGHTTTKMLDEVYGKIDPKELEAEMRRALEPMAEPMSLPMLPAAGSILDEPWINGSQSGETVDPVAHGAAAKTPETSAQGQNRTVDTGIFSPTDVATNAAEKASEPPPGVDESWIGTVGRPFISGLSTWPAAADWAAAMGGLQ